MLLSVRYALIRLLLELLLVRSRPAMARDVELLALRQEVRVLRRRAKRARYHPGDRLVLGGPAGGAHPRSAHPGRTRAPSGGWARCGGSAWIAC